MRLIKHIPGAGLVRQIRGDAGDMSIGGVGDPPTDAELNGVSGTTPEVVGPGWSFFIDDNDADKCWLIVSNGTDWYYAELTKAT